MTGEDEIRAAAERVWPRAKRIEVWPSGFARDASPTSAPVTASQIIAYNAQDRIIGQVFAESLDALKAKLDKMTPDGGHAP
jgi:hypothetical protein